MEQQSTNRYPEVAEKDKKKWIYIRKMNAFFVFLVLYIGLKYFMFDGKVLSTGEFFQLFLVYMILNFFVRIAVVKTKMESVVADSFIFADDYEKQYLQPNTTK